MPGIIWEPGEREREWAFAKEKLNPHGKLLPNGAKLRRKDHPEALNHSFMVIDDRIIALSGKGIYLGKGRDAHAKLAEDEAGNLIALKIITRDGGESNSAIESHIAYDLGIAGQRVTRSSASKKFPTKHYIAYQYLGTRLIYYLYENKSLSLDKRYELCIKISLALHEIHTGKKTKSKKAYQHGDIHWGNLVINEHGEPHFIDFGRARGTYGKNEGDIVSMLLLFFTPIQNRNHRHGDWIFGDWMGEYEFLYSPPDFDPEEKQYYIQNHTIHVYLNQGDKNAEDAYSILHYAVLDPYGVFHEGTFNLNDIGLNSITPKRKQLTCCDLEEEERELIEKKILEVTNRDGYTLSQENRNETLFNLLKDPTAFYKTSQVPTALDVAETLTLCRLNLESYKNMLPQRSAEQQYEMINILNVISTPLLELYKKIDALSNTNGTLLQSVKDEILSHLFTLPMENTVAIRQSIDAIDEDEPKALYIKSTAAIRQSIDAIIEQINTIKSDSLKAAFSDSNRPMPDQKIHAENALTGETNVAGGGAAAHLPDVRQNLPQTSEEMDPERIAKTHKIPKDYHAAIASLTKMDFTKIDWTKLNYSNHSNKPVPAQKIQEDSHAAHKSAVPSEFTLNDAIRYYGNHFNHGFYVNGTQKSADISVALSVLEDKSDKSILNALNQQENSLYKSVNFSRIMHKPELSIIAVLKEFYDVAQTANERFRNKNTPEQLLKLYNIAHKVLKHGDENSIKKAIQMVRALNDFQLDKNLDDALKTALTNEDSALHRSFNAHRSSIFKLFPVINTKSYIEALNVVKSPSKEEPTKEEPNGGKFKP